MEQLDAECAKRYQLKFAALDAARATEVLTALEAAPETDLGAFFKTIKDLTIDGYYGPHQDGILPISIQGREL